MEARLIMPLLPRLLGSVDERQTALKTGDMLDLYAYTIGEPSLTLTADLSSLDLPSSTVTTSSGPYYGQFGSFSYPNLYAYYFGTYQTPALSGGRHPMSISGQNSFGAAAVATSSITIDNAPPTVTLDSVAFTGTPGDFTQFTLSGHGDGTGSALKPSQMIVTLYDAAKKPLLMAGFSSSSGNIIAPLVSAFASLPGTFTAALKLPNYISTTTYPTTASLNIKLIVYDGADNTASSSISAVITKPAPPDPCVATNSCTSNVLFLPGIEGSRLYEGTGCGKSTEDRLWEPFDGIWKAVIGVGDKKVSDLALDESGESVCSDIYAKEGDIIDTVGGSNLYKSFIDEMNGLKSDGIIKDWKPAAYDWRLSLNDLLSKGAVHQGRIYYGEATSTPYIEQTLRSLAASSKTGKVTIVAHSNGGLVAKALLAKLGDTEAAKLVDRVIMVAVPQTGAPADIGSLLVGYGAGLYQFSVPIVSNAAARTFAQNSPMAFHLLPSEDYLESTAGDSAHPVIRFSGAGYAKEEAAYGSSIANRSALDDFLLAKDGGRQQAADTDLTSAKILNPALITYANAQHDALDFWTPPAGIKVDQIAGWGIDTVEGVDFYTAPVTDAASALNPVRAYRPLLVEDGDGTVPVPSAIMMASSTDVTRYWIDLHSYSKLTSTKRTHGDIFEVPSLENFIKNILTNSTSTLPAYISRYQPMPITEDKKLTFFLHSPLTLQLTDASGNVTGLAADGSVTQDIPGSTYGQFGEVKYVTVPEGSAYQLAMRGQASGTFSLDVQESSGDTVIASSTIAGVPTTASTTVAMSVQSDLSTLSPMTLDENGDGVTDAIITPKVDDTVIFDTIPPELALTFSTSTDSLAFIASDNAGAATVSSSTSYPIAKKNQKTYQGIATTTVTARDLAGNTTQLIYTERLPSSKQRVSISLAALVYNDATSTIINASLSYKWRSNSRNGSISLFASSLRTATSSLESHYLPKRDQTILMSKPREIDDSDSDEKETDMRPIKQVLPGMVIPSMKTEQGKLIITY